VTFTGISDAFPNRLNAAAGNYTAMLNVYDEITLEPLQMAVMVQVVIDYYSGTSDGFAGFGTLCPANEGPASPTVCLTNSTNTLNEPSAVPSAQPNPSSSAEEKNTSHLIWNIIGGGCGLVAVAFVGYY
jgi:hypothetical protein